MSFTLKSSVRSTRSQHKAQSSLSRKRLRASTNPVASHHQLDKRVPKGTTTCLTSPAFMPFKAHSTPLHNLDQTREWFFHSSFVSSFSCGPPPCLKGSPEVANCVSTLRKTMSAKMLEASETNVTVSTKCFRCTNELATVSYIVATAT
jgi:hypothetical protein